MNFPQYIVLFQILGTSEYLKLLSSALLQVALKVTMHVHIIYSDRLIYIKYF